MYLETLDLVGNFVTSVPAGLEMPYHATTMGKAILAFQTNEFVGRIIAAGLIRYTDDTIGLQLKRELEVDPRLGLCPQRRRVPPGRLRHCGTAPEHERLSCRRD